jgi:hypothetical protein
MATTVSHYPHPLHDLPSTSSSHRHLLNKSLTNPIYERNINDAEKASSAKENFKKKIVEGDDEEEGGEAASPSLKSYLQSIKDSQFSDAYMEVYAYNQALEAAERLEEAGRLPKEPDQRVLNAVSMYSFFLFLHCASIG